MRRGGRVLVILGIVLALVSGAGVFAVLASAEPAPVEAPTTKLVVAYQPITERSEIAPDQIGVVDWPLKIPTPTGATDKSDQVIGKFAKVAIYPGQPVIGQMLIDKTDLKENHSNAALLLDKGMVAIAMPVTMNTNVASAIQVGDRVDLLATFTAQGSSGDTRSGPSTAASVLLQDLLILQVGPWPSPGTKQDAASSSAIITFQMNEQDALVLKYSLEKSDGLTLALRPANDHEVNKPEPVTLDYINKRFGFKLAGVGQ